MRCFFPPLSNSSHCGEGAEFNAAVSLFLGKYESHTRVHTGEKPFECDICHQRYSTKYNLTVHRKKHSSETDFHKKEHKCPYCNKLHASRKTLAKHVKRQVWPCFRHTLTVPSGLNTQVAGSVGGGGTCPQRCHGSAFCRL